MENKIFKKYEKAWINDLNREMSFNLYSIGHFDGFLKCMKSSLSLTENQHEILDEYTKQTFKSENFNWLGKRKTASFIVSRKQEKSDE